MEIKTVSLRDYSSLRIGGEGKLTKVSSILELKDVVMHAKAEGLRVHVIGGGTNSYFGDDLGFFLFVQLNFKGINFVDTDKEVIVTVGANEIWDDLVKQCVQKGLWGIENLSYIPGTVGGAPVQNIGAYGTELKDTLLSVTVFDIETEQVISLDSNACQFGYRDSLFKYAKGRYVITEIILKLHKEATPNLDYKPLDELKGKENLTLLDIRNAVVAIRKKKLPHYNEYPNCGSFFKNPVINQETREHLCAIYPEIPCIQTVNGYKISAAWLIEHIAEMKGIKIGSVGTWPHQPLVLINYESAQADDIDTFTHQIESIILEKTGIMLEQEVNRVG